MGIFGNLLGGALGSLGSTFLPLPGINGKEFGSALGGAILPFKRGGRVPRTKSGRFKKRKSRK